MTAILLIALALQAGLEVPIEPAACAAGGLSVSVTAPLLTASRSVPAPVALTCRTRKGLAECAAPVGRWNVRVALPGCRPAFYGDVLFLPGARLRVPKYVPGMGARVFGTVAWPRGTQPGRAIVSARRLAGAAIKPVKADATPTVPTDERDSFAIGGLLPGRYSVVARAGNLSASTIVVLREDETKSLSEPLTLHPAARVKLQVSPPGIPWGGSWAVQVSVAHNSGDLGKPVAAGTVGDDGRWTSPAIVPGSYELSILSGNQDTWWSKSLELSGNDLEVDADMDLVEIRGRLLKGDRGYCAKLLFGGVWGLRRIPFESDQNGRFSGFLPEEGRWDVDLQSIGDSRILSQSLGSVEVKTPPDGGPAEVTLRIERGIVDVTAHDETGAVAGSGSIVSLMPVDGSNRLLQATLQEDGTVEIAGVRPGSYMIRGGDDYNFASEWTPFSVSDSDDAQHVELTLRRLYGVQGRVTSSGVPVPGAQILYQPVTGLGSLNVGGRFSRADDAGLFELRMPAGQVDVLVSAPGMSFSLSSFVVSQDSPTAAAIDLEPIGGTILLPELPLKSAGIASQATLWHRGAIVPVSELIRQQLVQEGVDRIDPERLRMLRSMESGQYTLCLAGATACSTGYLSLQGVLDLNLGSQKGQKP